MRLARAAGAALAVLAVAALAAAWITLVVVPARVEARVRAMAVQLEARTGARVTIGSVGFSWLGPVELRDVRIAGPGTLAASVRTVDVAWTLRGGGDPAAHVTGVALEGVEATRDAWRIASTHSSWDRLQARGDQGAGEAGAHDAEHDGALLVRWRRGPGALELDILPDGLDLGALVDVQRQGRTPARLGRTTGTAHVTTSADALATHGALRMAGLQVAVAADGGPPALGPPTDAAASWDVTRAGKRTHVAALHLEVAGSTVDAHGSVSRWDDDAGAHAALDVSATARVDIARALATAGLHLPPEPPLPAGDLGTASLDATARGDVSDPSSLEVRPRLSFTPAAPAIAALEPLRRPFTYTADDQGTQTRIELRPGAPWFVPYAEVPALLVRTVVISEDAGFWGHPGIDAAEIPVAWAENRERGTAARGASTITQQLVKNLYLSRARTYDRKLLEAALALLVDAAVPKERLLEIYLNVIEWGPGVHGLGQASQHYFGKEPAALTPKEIAFLVCLIPAPVRYHQAHTLGRVGPGMEELMANLLAKMSSVGAIDEEQYRAALEETLQFAPEGAASPRQDPQPRGVHEPGRLSPVGGAESPERSRKPLARALRRDEPGGER